MVKAVIFDFDGVIVDSESIHLEAEKQTLLKHGVSISAEELRKYMGMTAKEMFEDLIKKYKLYTTVERIFSEKDEILFRLLKEVHPTNGVIPLLQRLKDHGAKLAIASSAHRKLIDHVLEKLCLTGVFEIIVSSEDVSRGKPDPLVFYESAKKLQIDPRDCVVIEDAEAGVRAAKQAGMFCIGYRNPNSGNQDLTQADIVISDFSELDVEQLLQTIPD